MGASCGANSAGVVSGLSSVGGASRRKGGSTAKLRSISCGASRLSPGLASRGGEGARGVASFSGGAAGGASGKASGRSAWGSGGAGAAEGCCVPGVVDGVEGAAPVRGRSAEPGAVVSAPGARRKPVPGSEFGCRSLMSKGFHDSSSRRKLLPPGLPKSTMTRRCSSIDRIRNSNSDGCSTLAGDLRRPGERGDVLTSEA